MNQFIEQLRRHLAEATEPNAKMEAAGRLSAAYARLGQFASAKAAIQGSKTTWSAGTLWIMLAEAVILNVEQQSADAMDRLKRSLALAVPLKYTRFIGNASAWKAHFEFEASNFESMMASLEQARLHAEEDDLDAHTRMCIDIASTYFMCGRSLDGLRWFNKGHRIATSRGDQASIEALVYNRAALQFARARVDSCLAPLDPQLVRSLRMDVNSTRNLNVLFRTAALLNHLDLLEARLLGLEGEHERAYSRLQSLRNAKPFAANHFSAPYLDLELAFAKLQCSDTAYVRSYVESEPDCDFSSMDDDDRIVASCMLARLHSGISDEHTANRYAEQQAALMQRYFTRCSEIGARLDALLSQPKNQDTDQTVQ